MTKLAIIIKALTKLNCLVQNGMNKKWLTSISSLLGLTTLQTLLLNSTLLEQYC